MKITRLAASNIKRITAVNITPEGHVVTIGGENGAGKSSVLDSIAYALGGASLIPEEPIRGDESEAKIEVDLGDFIVTRTFKRDKEVTAKDANDQPIYGWGPIKSGLVIKNKDGAQYPSPQSMLDKLMGRLTFDPLAFKNEHHLKQAETLRTLVGLDTADLDKQRGELYGQRTAANQAVTQAEANIAVMVFHQETPAEEISMSEISTAMADAEAKRRVAAEAARSFEAANERKDRVNASVTVHRQELLQLQKLIESEETMLEEAKSLVASTQAALEKANSDVPDIKVLQDRLSEIEATNRKVRDNKKLGVARAEIEELRKKAKGLTNLIDLIDTKKAEKLAAVKYPIDGLGFGEYGVTFNGYPLKQASHAEQLKVSVAIGLALNHQLKVLLIRDGNALDSKSLAQVAQLATDAGAQVWIEMVAESKDGVSVFIEDGHVG